MGGYLFTSRRQIQFNCVYNQRIFKFVSFEHNGSLVFSDGRFYIQESGNHHALIVNNTQAADSGEWSCTVERRKTGEQIFARTTVKYVG